MSLYEKITKLVDEEVEHRLNAVLNEYAEVLSKKHGISLDVLLKDLPETYTSTTCKGAKANGQRCTFKGIHNGYCSRHVVQGARINLNKSLSSTNLHSHGPEKFYDPECPACQQCTSGLRDLGI
jgi:hypothetical protein